MTKITGLTVGDLKQASDKAKTDVAKEIITVVMPFFKKSEQHINGVTDDVNTLIANVNDLNARLERLEKQCKK